MSTLIAVLGCGPAGLMAAHAANLQGYEVKIFSKKRKSEMYGAQYLHAPIPGVSTDMDKFEVKYELKGDPSEYRKKVYGPNWSGTVSPEDLSEDHFGWDIRLAYDILWQHWVDHIEDTDFSTTPFSTLARDLAGGDQQVVFVNSIPRPVLCTNPDQHAFAASTVWAVGDAPERGVFSPVRVPRNTVVCNGEENPRWYRASNILGFHTAEWPEQSKPPIEGISKVTKPLSTTCDCHPYVHHVGRYGKWTKGVLSHSAFEETFQGLKVGSR